MKKNFGYYYYLCLDLFSTPLLTFDLSLACKLGEGGKKERKEEIPYYLMSFIKEFLKSV